MCSGVECYASIVLLGTFFNFKLYLFHNNNTQLQIGHEVILLGGDFTFSNIFDHRKPLKCLPWIKTPILLKPAVGFEPTTSQSLSGGVNT